ncbi:hypothetical protein STIV2_C54b [Sulfolobus turreted icosahedral virus 2]|uniref:Uncharacterized protein n=1 Tax=Sulfolobus turreted icosahedral virus 2 TaxID=754004 RepID=D5IEZ1_9VIRU|nr:hypothetical protein STIV2_C54b [Sulfolobus turreted icosahedral virus 2]ADF27763.1 hypothetical protein STIV2_C54b [Sulfolobus turreted icosahedral virus 2]
MAKGKKTYKTFPLDEETYELLVKAMDKAKEKYGINTKLGTLKLALKKLIEDEER